MGTQTSIGRHIGRIETDIVHAEMHGVMSYEEAVQFIELYDRIHTEYGYVLIMLNLNDSTTVDLKARRLLVDWTKRKRLAGMAGYGGSTLARTMVSLIVGAARLLMRDAPVVAFFKDESGARLWLAAQREIALAGRHLGGSPGSK